MAAPEPEPEHQPIPIEPLEAMIAGLVLNEAFMSIPLDRLPVEVTHGVVLLFDTMLQRLRPLLPGDVPEFHATATAARQTAAIIRERYGLPPVI